MAFPAALKVLGPALTSVAEGLQAVPQYIDRDEELQDKHEERLARRELRPLTLEEAKLRLQKSREDLEHPKPITAGAHGSYVFNPATRKYEYDAQSAALGGTQETAVIRKMRSLYTMANDASNPQLAAAAKGELDKISGVKTTAQQQSMRRYFEAINRGEAPDPVDAELMQIIVNRSVRGSAEGGYYPFNAPLPGTPGQTPPQTPPTAPPVPAPGSAAPAQPGTPRVTPRTTGGPSGPPGPLSNAVPSSLTPTEEAMRNSYTAYFRQAGEKYAREVLGGMVRSQHPNAQIAVEALTLAYPTSGLRIPSHEVPPLAGAQTPPPAVAAPTPGAPAPIGSGPTPKYKSTEEIAKDKAMALPTWKPEQVAKAQELFPWLGARPDLRTLSNEQVNMVNKMVEANKEETGYHRTLRQAAPQIAELASMDSSLQMAQRAEQLLAPETVGMRGKANRLRQQVIQQLPFSARAKHQWFDPRIPDLEVVAHAIGYIHANAIKRIGAAGGPGQRGVVRYDVEEITKWFDPFAATASVPEMKEKLRELQRLIQQARPMVEREMFALGIEPKTLAPIKGRKFGTPGPEPAAIDPNTIIDEALKP